MTYRLIYSKPHSEVPLTAVPADREEAMLKAHQLERVGYSVSVWEYDEQSGREIYNTSSGTMTIKEIAAAAGMSCRKLAERYGIPYKTVEGWMSGKHDPPPYVLALLRDVLGV